jgi:hypothetical protein
MLGQSELWTHLTTRNMALCFETAVFSDLCIVEFRGLSADRTHYSLPDSCEETVPGAATTHLLPTSRAGVHRARVVELVKTGPDGPGS